MGIFAQKTQTIKFNDFMDGSYKMSKDEKQTLGALALMPAATFLSADHTFAAGTQEIIMKAFDPLIDLMQGISYPICFLMIGGGFLLVMMGQGHRGMRMIKWAAIGYVGLQFAPAIMSILVEVGKAMKGAY